MPAATYPVPHIDPAKALSRHDRVNHTDDACGSVAIRCCLLKGHREGEGVAELNFQCIRIIPRGRDAPAINSTYVNSAVYMFK